MTTAWLAYYVSIGGVLALFLADASNDFMPHDKIDDPRELLPMIAMAGALWPFFLLLVIHERSRR